MAATSDNGDEDHDDRDEGGREPRTTVGAFSSREAAKRAVAKSGCTILALMMRKFQNYLLLALLEQLIDSIFAIYSSRASPFIGLGLVVGVRVRVGSERKGELERKFEKRFRWSERRKESEHLGRRNCFFLYPLPLTLALAIISASQPAIGN